MAEKQVELGHLLGCGDDGWRGVREMTLSWRGGEGGGRPELSIAGVDQMECAPWRGVSWGSCAKCIGGHDPFLRYSVPQRRYNF